MEMLELNCENAKIYRISKTLKRPFSTSSGTLTHKDIIVIVFENNHRPEFIFELPFSPSMGEMPDSFIENMQNGNSYYFDVARSWYEYFKARQKLPLVSNPIEQCIHTYGIGDIEFSDSGLIRMKVAATNLDELIKREELEDLLEKSNSYTNEYPSILLGDFQRINRLLDGWCQCENYNIYTKGVNVITCWREVEKGTEKIMTHFRI